jgi:CHAT domain-containing protein
MKGGESHTYRLTLAEGDYVRVVVDQEGVDVVVSIYDPERRLLIRMDSPNGMRGPEAASALARVAGDYIVEVVAYEPPLAGGYVLRVEGPRAAVAADETRVEAERQFVAAQQEPSVANFERALALWRQLGDAGGEGYTLCALGQTYKKLSKLSDALDNFALARERLHAVRDVPGEAYVLNETGAAYRDLGNPLDALPLYDRALELRTEIGDLWGQAQMRNNIGYLYSRIGRQQKALENYEQALPLWRSAGDLGKEFRTRNNIALVYLNTGSLTEAYEEYQKLLSSCREAGDHALEPFVVNSLGMIHDTWGDPQEALRQYNQALALFARSEGTEREQAMVLDNIGMVSAGLGDAQDALLYFNQAYEIRKLLKEPAGTAATQSNIGYAQSILGNHQEALHYLEDALANSRQSNERRFEAYTLVREGSVYVALKDVMKALANYQQALVIQTEVEDRRGQAITQDQIGQAYALLGETAKALDSYEKALKNWVAVKDIQGQALTLYGLARIESNRNNLPAARDLIEQALNLTESLRSKTTGHQLRLIFFAGKQDLYDLDVDVRMRLYALSRSREDAEAALFAHERARARDLLDLLIEARVESRREVPPVAAGEYRRLGQQISALTQDWLRLRQLGKADAAAAEEKLSALIKERERLRGQAIANDGIPTDATRSKVLSPPEIQRLLDDDTLLLEYAVAGERIHLWAITRDAIRPYTLTGREEIERAADRLRGMLTVFEPQRRGVNEQEYLARVRASVAQYKQAAFELSRMVLGPVAQQLGERRLVVVADGPLQYIPFEALPPPQYPDNAYRSSGQPTYTPLLATHEVVYQPSASTLALLRIAPPRKATKEVAVLADPVFDSDDERARALQQKRGAPTPKSLPKDLGRSLRDVGDFGDGSGGFKLSRLQHSGEEADAITSSARPGLWMKAVGFEANRSIATSNALGQFRVVHFATHSLLNDQHPELSGIVLSMIDEEGNSEDGYLSLGDIYNLELPVDLVVLSACRTGIGKQVRGEGLMGLTRGFMYAGSSRVVASLWKVDDRATSELMRRFYQLMLRQNLPPAAALRKAKIEMMELSKWRHPFYWAGFVLQGDWK